MFPWNLKAQLFYKEHRAENRIWDIRLQVTAGLASKLNKNIKNIVFMYEFNKKFKV